MSQIWERIRYRGDAADIRELHSTYKVDAYLQTYENNRKQQEQAIRNQLMTQGVRLTERLSPRIYNISRNVVRNLGLDLKPEIFCVSMPGINAFAIHDISEQGEHLLIGFTPDALEKLEDGELTFILGHELGHFLYQNNKYNSLLVQDPNNPAVTVLPFTGEALFLRWQKKAEISADRIGLLACRDLPMALRALIKAAFGLSEKNLITDVEALLSQIEEVKGQPELMAATFASHPILPVRLKSLDLFSKSLKYTDFIGMTTGQEEILDDKLECSVDDLVSIMRRYPSKRCHLLIMKALAMGGIIALGADGCVSDEEIKGLLMVLQKNFTDMPEEEIIVDIEKISQELPPILKAICEECNEREKMFLISRLVEIVVADGSVIQQEVNQVMQIATAIGIEARDAQSIVMGAMQHVGFKGVDPKLNQLATTLRRSLQSGFGFV